MKKRTFAAILHRGRRFGLRALNKFSYKNDLRDSAIIKRIIKKKIIHNKKPVSNKILLHK